MYIHHICVFSYTLNLSKQSTRITMVSLMITNFFGNISVPSTLSQYQNISFSLCNISTVYTITKIWLGIHSWQLQNTRNLSVSQPSLHVGGQSASVVEGLWSRSRGRFGCFVTRHSVVGGGEVCCGSRGRR